MFRKLKTGLFSRSNLKEIFIFTLVGIVVTATYYFLLLWLIEDIKIPYLISNIIAVCTVTAISFIGHKYFTFKATHKATRQEVFLFILQSISAFLVSSLILYICDQQQIDNQVSALAIIIIIPITNFFVMKFVIFKKTPHL